MNALLTFGVGASILTLVYVEFVTITVEAMPMFSTYGPL